MAMPSGVAYSGFSNSTLSENTESAKLFPAMATRLSSISSFSATFSRSPVSLLPPPARNTAEGAASLTLKICLAMASASRFIGSWMAWTTSAAAMRSSWPKIFRQRIRSSLSPMARFTCSAVLKSTRKERIMASVTSSPATVAMV